jgi:para-nitrobenzyl esterase
MGTSMNRMNTLAQGEEVGKRVFTAMNVSSIGELRAKTPDDLQRGSGFTGNIIIDGYIVPEDLSRTYAQGRQNAVDVLVGSNQDEGTFFGGGGRGGGGGGAQAYVTQARGRFEELTDTYLKLYPGTSDAEAAASQLMRTRDEFFWHMLLWAKSQSRLPKAKAWAFYFTRVPPGGTRGATHTAELPYAFNNLIGNTAWTDADRALAETMTSYWVNFAGTGDPNGRNLPAWPAFKEGTSERVIVLGDKVAASDSLSPERTRLFDAAYTKLNVK